MFFYRDWKIDTFFARDSQSDTINTEIDRSTDRQIKTISIEIKRSAIFSELWASLISTPRDKSCCREVVNHIHQWKIILEKEIEIEYIIWNLKRNIVNVCRVKEKLYGDISMKMSIPQIKCIKQKQKEILKSSSDQSWTIQMDVYIL